MLGELQLPDEVDDDKVRILKLLASNLRSVRPRFVCKLVSLAHPRASQRRPPRDTSAKNVLSKFEDTLLKKYEKALENFSEDELWKLEELKDLTEFLDNIIPLNEDEDEAPKKGRKRYVPHLFGHS